MNEQAKANIKQEFMQRYAEWLNDVNNLTDTEFGKKWGMGRTELTPRKDNMKAVECFQRYWGISRYPYEWKNAGYDMKDIWALHRAGFLSLQEFWGSRARQMGQSEAYYISQRAAKEIYREAKKGA